MFTGIIEATAGILAMTDGRLTLERPASFRDVKIGSSISISGVCLTIVEMDDRSFSFDVIPETFAKTTLGSKKSGDRVNLECALAATGRFDGHVVQGHVEGTGAVVSIVEVSLPRPLPPEEGGELSRKSPALSTILSFARDMRSKPTIAEDLLWQALRSDQLGVRFRRQHPVGGRILDFYCPKHRFAIEVDGGIHKSAKIQKEDRIRTQHLNVDYDIGVLRFTNEEILENLNDVITRIQKYMEASSPPPLEEGLGEEAGLGQTTVTIRPPSDLLPFIIPKGSITIDGVSLTIASVEKDAFSVALIPQTLKETTLGDLREGDEVNLETDILVRAVLSRRVL